MAHSEAELVQRDPRIDGLPVVANGPYLVFRGHIPALDAIAAGRSPLPYLLGRHIAADVYEAIYRAEDLLPFPVPAQANVNRKTKLVIKVFEEPAKGKREALMQRRANHVGIGPRCYGFAVAEDGRGYLVSERVDGETIASRAGDAEEGDEFWHLRLSKAHSWAWMLQHMPDQARQLEAAIDALNHAGMLYPDRTPYNTMVDRATGRVVLIDFEHAKRFGGDVLEDGRSDSEVDPENDEHWPIIDVAHWEEGCFNTDFF
jgi:hypothetical protein